MALESILFRYRDFTRKIRQIEVNIAKYSGNICDLTIFLLLKFLTWEFLLFILMIALSELLS